MNVSLLIMAAGMGSRYGGLKQLDHVGHNGETLLEYSIFDAIRAKFKDVTFIIRKEIEPAFNQFIFPRLQNHIPIHYAYQELSSFLPNDIDPNSLKRIKPWGTAHAVLCAKDQMHHNPFVVINGDDYYGPESFQLVHDFFSKNTDAPQHCLVGYPLEQTLSPNGPVSRGICRIDHNNYLISLEERLKIRQDHSGHILDFPDDGHVLQLSGDDIASMNLWGFNPSILDSLEDAFHVFAHKHLIEPKAEFQLPTIVSSLNSNQASFQTLLTKDQWFGITYKDDLQYVQAHIRQLISRGVYPEKLWP